MRIILLFLIAVFPSAHTLACTEYPDRGVDVSELPPAIEAQESFTISLSAFSMLPPRKPDGVSCRGGQIELYLLTDDPKATYDGYLMIKLIDGILPHYFKQRIQNVTLIKDNTGSFGFIPEMDQWDDVVNMRFQVQYISSMGKRSEWSEAYDLSYSGGDRWFLKRYFEPELKPKIHSELVATANLMVNLLFESDVQKTANKKSAQIDEQLGSEFSGLLNSLGELAQTYTQFAASNLNAFEAYPVYRDFYLSSFRYYSLLNSQGDTTEVREELIESLTRFKREWDYCQHIFHKAHPRFTNLEDEIPNNLHKIVITRVESALLSFVLEECRGNQSQAAQLLGISVSGVS